MNKHQTIIPDSTITCPECGGSQKESMPTDVCQWFYECPSCHVVLKPQQGDCCVFCSYGDIACPSIQQNQSCCDENDA
ncbi:MAG: GDCCVxC domain-containing (seleno)protein [Ghiorsea sp.]|nr:GDCCVxC domain-containing (seleno)protein [Ghiorsea sp.]